MAENKSTRVLCFQDQNPDDYAECKQETEDSLLEHNPGATITNREVIQEGRAYWYVLTWTV